MLVRKVLGAYFHGYREIDARVSLTGSGLTALFGK